MKISYKNKKLELSTTIATMLTSAVVIATFVLLYGFEKELLPPGLLHTVQIFAFIVFLTEKILRFTNALSKRQFLRAYWFEIPLLIILAVTALTAYRYPYDVDATRMFALSAYLIVQVIAKACKGMIHIASTGKNPTTSLIAIFVVLIIVGACALKLPRSYTCQNLSFTDAMFTATSATCVTGLIVKDTGTDLSTMGQIIILTLIQLGGLGIVIFGAVLALLLGQALTVKESVAMQDLLSEQTLGSIGKIIAFIFTATLLIEAIGAFCLMPMYTNTGSNITHPVFHSVFHSISAFCNAGFSLHCDSLIGFNTHPAVFLVISPLIILGGLGFSVLYNLSLVTADKIKRNVIKILHPGGIFELSTPKKISLQTKIVLSSSLILIVFGAISFLVFENNGPASNHTEIPISERLLNATFQSVTARTAGFNSIEINDMTPASKFIMIMLMLIGGSPGSTAGGIKTVTVVVLIMTAYATMRKRREVELFNRSLRPIVVGRAITVTLLFIAVFIVAVLALSITEKNNDFGMDDIFFESASALGTVGLSTGITPALTTTGKWIIIALMLIGRLGPLTLLAAMTFNIRPARYSYPAEPVIVG